MKVRLRSDFFYLGTKGTFPLAPNPSVRGNVSCKRKNEDAEE